MKAYITRMAYYLPDNVEENEKGRLLKKTGIERRHICAENMTASDLAVRAAEKIFASDFAKEHIDFVLYCTQSPDYPLPSTACILQDRLGLSKYCGALDFDLGCSGFVYGLGLAKGLVESGQAKNVLLLTSETYTKYINPNDHAVRPLFGDASAATVISAVEADAFGISGMVYGTDGSGANNLIVPVGGMRQRYQTTPVTTTTDQYGNFRTNQNIFMDGGAIMNFALDVVPTTVEKILQKTSLTKEQIDYYVFHQANKFVLRSLQQLCDLTELPFWNNVSEYGNTVSNSIPIAMVDMINGLLESNDDKNLKHVMLVGFGVGLSWAGCVVDLSKIIN